MHIGDKFDIEEYNNRMIAKSILYYDRYVKYFDIIRQSFEGYNNIHEINENDLAYLAVKTLHDFVKMNKANLKIDVNKIEVINSDNTTNYHLVKSLNRLINLCKEYKVPEIIERANHCIS